MPLLSYCESFNSTVLGGLTLFIARGGNELMYTNLTSVIWSSNDVFRCSLSLPLSYGGHNFLSVWGDLALCDLMLRHPVCVTVVFRCFHHPRREGGSQFRLLHASVSLRRRQST